MYVYIYIYIWLVPETVLLFYVLLGLLAMGGIDSYRFPYRFQIFLYIHTARVWLEPDWGYQFGWRVVSICVLLEFPVNWSPIGAINLVKGGIDPNPSGFPSKKKWNWIFWSKPRSKLITTPHAFLWHSCYHHGCKNLVLGYRLTYRSPRWKNRRRPQFPTALLGGIDFMEPRIDWSPCVLFFFQKWSCFGGIDFVEPRIDSSKNRQGGRF